MGNNFNITDKAMLNSERHKTLKNTCTRISSMLACARRTFLSLTITTHINQF